MTPATLGPMAGISRLTRPCVASETKVCTTRARATQEVGAPPVLRVRGIAAGRRDHDDGCAGTAGQVDEPLHDLGAQRAAAGDDQRAVRRTDDRNLDSPAESLTPPLIIKMLRHFELQSGYVDPEGLGHRVRQIFLGKINNRLQVRETPSHRRIVRRNAVPMPDRALNALNSCASTSTATAATMYVAARRGRVRPSDGLSDEGGGMQKILFGLVAA